MISNSNWTEWSTIQGVIGRVISKSAEREARGRFEITSTITPWIVRHEVQLPINCNYSSATSASSMTRTVQLLRHDAYNCPITSAWRLQLYNYGWNQACWWPIRFEKLCQQQNARTWLVVNSPYIWLNWLFQVQTIRFDPSDYKHL